MNKLLVEWTGAGVEWLTSVPEVPGSVLSRGTFRCGPEQVTFPQLLRQWSEIDQLSKQ